MMEKQRSCRERIRENLDNRIYDLEKLRKAYESDTDKEVEDPGTFDEYGLAFDYVAPNTFPGQRRGYFRYQLSWAGHPMSFVSFAMKTLFPSG